MLVEKWTRAVVNDDPRKHLNWHLNCLGFDAMPPLIRNYTSPHWFDFYVWYFGIYIDGQRGQVFGCFRHTVGATWQSAYGGCLASAASVGAQCWKPVSPAGNGPGTPAHQVLPGSSLPSPDWIWPAAPWAPPTSSSHSTQGSFCV